jgi:peptidoglycan hydrolase-like protein with peptidoglycan-binding domain
LDTSEFNSRGLLVIGAAVVVTVILLAVVPKGGPLGGVSSGGSVSAATGTTAPTGTTLTPGTTLPGTTETTKKGSSATTTTASTRATVQVGSSGQDVVYLQQRLIALGYLTGTADGSFGTGTQAAVIKFQQAKSISPADGVVGPATWAALG